MVSDLIEWALYNGMFVYLSEALQAEGMPAWERERFLLRVVVLLEAHATFKYRIHSSLSFFNILIILQLFGR